MSIGCCLKIGVSVITCMRLSCSLAERAHLRFLLHHPKCMFVAPLYYVWSLQAGYWSI